MAEIDRDMDPVVSLQGWLLERGARLHNIRVIGTDSRDRGVVAAVPIEAGQEVLVRSLSMCSLIVLSGAR